VTWTIHLIRWVRFAKSLRFSPMTVGRSADDHQIPVLLRHGFAHGARNDVVHSPNGHAKALNLSHSTCAKPACALTRPSSPGNGRGQLATNGSMLFGTSMSLPKLGSLFITRSIGRVSATHVARCGVHRLTIWSQAPVPSRDRLWGEAVARACALHPCGLRRRQHLLKCYRASTTALVLKEAHWLALHSAIPRKRAAASKRSS
jgi:hypothetical protein